MLLPAAHRSRFTFRHPVVSWAEAMRDTCCAKHERPAVVMGSQQTCMVQGISADTGQGVYSICQLSIRCHHRAEQAYRAGEGSACGGAAVRGLRVPTSLPVCKVRPGCRVQLPTASTGMLL